MGNIMKAVNVKAISIALIAIVGAFIGLRRPTTQVFAQTTFNGVTIVQKVYNDCNPDRAGCAYFTTRTEAWDRSFA